MTVSTYVFEGSRSIRTGGTMYGWQAEGGEFVSAKNPRRTTIPCGTDESIGSAPTSAHGLLGSYEPPVSTLWSPTSPDSAPLQIWEGTVLKVDHEAGAMQVLLDAKMGQVPRHSAEIDLEWVSDQDKDLVRPGAVFYLTLFKRTKRGSVENAQELRFRRRPSWSLTQLKRIEESASSLAAKMKALPIAE